MFHTRHHQVSTVEPGAKVYRTLMLKFETRKLIPTYIEQIVKRKFANMDTRSADRCRGESARADGVAKAAPKGEEDLPLVREDWVTDENAGLRKQARIEIHWRKREIERERNRRRRK